MIGEGARGLSSVLISSIAPPVIGTLGSLAVNGIMDWFINNVVYGDENKIIEGNNAREETVVSSEQYFSRENSLVSLASALSGDTSKSFNVSEAIKIVSEHYDELLKGVNPFTGSMDSLPPEKQQELKTLNAQLTNLFPEYVGPTGMFNVGNNTESVMTNYMDAVKKKSYADSTENIDEIFEGTKTELKDIDKKIEEKREQKRKVISTANSISEIQQAFSKDSLYLKPDQVNPFGKIVDNSLKNRITYTQHESGNGIQYSFTGVASEDSIDQAMAEFESSTAPKKDGFNKTIKGYNDDINDLNRQKHGIISSFTPVIAQQIALSEEFSSLTPDMQSAVLTNLDEFDKFNESDLDIKNYVKENYLSPIEELSSEAQENLESIFNLDPNEISFSEFKDYLNKTLDETFDNQEDRNYWYNALGFDKMDEAGWNSRRTQVEPEAPIEVPKYIPYTSPLQKYQEALTSSNSGDAYKDYALALENTKSLYDQKLYGMDDFKEGAVMFSPGGYDDETNFAENYNHMAKYFTPDSDEGIQNFLEDLNSLDQGYVNFDEKTQTLRPHIENLQQAAADMGMSFEPFMAVLQRMGDYDDSLNFFSTQEEGVEHISSLYTDLAKAQQELETLKAENPDNQAAIDQQQAEVDQIQASIEESKSNLSQITEKTAEDYDSEVSAAKDAYDTLSEERQKILDDGGENAVNIASLIGEKMEFLNQQYHLFENETPSAATTNQNTETSPASSTSPTQNGTGTPSTAPVNDPLGDTPSEATITIKANTAPASSQKALLLHEINSSSATVTVGADASQAASDVQSALSGVYTVSVNASVNTSGSSTSTDQGTPSDSKKIAEAYGGIIRNSSSAVLTGELGEELVVRGNRYFTVGTYGPEMVHLQKGDIVFNHKQTRDLLERGRTATHGKALAEGNAGKSTKIFDWIGTRLEYFGNKLKAVADKITDYITISTKKSLISRQISITNKEMSFNQKAYKKYASKANAVDISSSMKKKLQSGSLSIEEIDTSTEEGQELAKNAEQYQSWYEKAAKCKTSVQELYNEQQKFYEQLMNMPTEQAEKKIDELTSKLKVLKNTYSSISGGSSLSVYRDLIKTDTDANEKKAKKALDASIQKVQSSKEIYNKKNKTMKNTGKKLISATNKSTASGSVKKAVKKAVKQGKNISSETLRKLSPNEREKAKQYNKTVSKKQNSKKELLAAKKQQSARKQEYKTAAASKTNIKKIITDNVNNPTYMTQNALLDAQLKETTNINKERQEASRKADNNLLKAQSESDSANKKSKTANKKLSGAKSDLLNNKKLSKNLTDAQKKAIQSGKTVSTKNVKDEKTLKALKEYNKALTASNNATAAAKTASNNLTTAQKAQTEATDAAASSQADLAEATLNTFQAQMKNIASFYESKTAFQESQQAGFASRLKTQKATSKAADGADIPLLQDLYQKQIASVQNQKVTLTAEKEALQKKLNEGISKGTIKEGTEEWYEWQRQIMDVDKSINDCDISASELADSLRSDVFYKSFELALEKAESLQKYLKTIKGLINDDMMFDDDGKLTEFGLTSLAMDFQNYDSLLGDAQTYINKIAEIKKQYATDSRYSRESYEKDMKEAQNGLQSTLGDLDSARNSILTVIKSQSKAELDAINKVIDARKELLRKKKDYYEYDKTLKNKTKEIQLLNQQIAALDGVSDAESRAKKARLEAQLQEQQEDLADTVRDHQYELQITGLEDLQDDLKESYEKYIKELSNNFDTMGDNITNLKDAVTGAASTVGNTIQAILNSFGINISASDIKPESLPGAAAGGIVSAESIRRNGDSGIASLKIGETVLTDKFTNLLPTAIDVMDKFGHTFGTMSPPIFTSPSVSSTPMKISFGTLLHIDNATPETANDLQKIIPDIARRVSQEIYKDMRKAGNK